MCLASEAQHFVSEIYPHGTSILFIIDFNALLLIFKFLPPDIINNVVINILVHPEVNKQLYITVNKQLYMGYKLTQVIGIKCPFSVSITKVSSKGD